MKSLQQILKESYNNSNANEFHDGRFVWMNKTHIKWWMKLPE